MSDNTEEVQHTEDAVREAASLLYRAHQFLERAIELNKEEGLDPLHGEALYELACEVLGLRDEAHLIERNVRKEVDGL